MKRMPVRRAVAAAMVSALGLTGIGFIDGLLGGSQAARGSDHLCC